MNFDTLLESLPVIGTFFERSYLFWRDHIAIANITHITFGIGIALFFASRYRRTGIILVILVLIVHAIAYSLS